MMETLTVKPVSNGHAPFINAAGSTPFRQAEVAKLEAPTGFMRREPIVWANSSLYGYELFYREGAENACEPDAEKTTQHLIDNYLLLMPRMDEGKGFVPCTRETLVAGLATLLPRRNTVLEILRTVEPDAELLATCRALRKTGYKFALDGFTSADSKRAFVDVADYIKLDYAGSSAEERRRVYELAGRSRIENMVVATKIETAEELETARREGCRLFQGGVFAKPATLTQETILPSNQVVCLRLMAALSDEAADTAKIETLVMQDASLCYRLLRLVNSVLYSLNSPVTSIRGALVVVGTDEFRKLVKVSLAGALAASQSKSLVALALVRARFCEMLSPQVNEPASKLYLLGMMSLIDAILKVSMLQILELLPLDQDMKTALLGGQSPIGLALELIKSYQAGDWEACDRYQKRLGLEEQTTAKLYLEAVLWADEAIRQ